MNDDAIRVLLLDDDPLTRRVVQHSLVNNLPENKFDFVEASNAEQALEIVRNNKIKLAIVDLVMPGRYGGDVFSVLAKTIDPKLKTILFSGTHDEMLRHISVAYKFDATIAKSGPDSLKSLALTCWEVLREARTESLQTV